MRREITIITPKLGQKVYVPSTETTIGGYAEIFRIEGDKVFMREAPHVPFIWEELVLHQIEYVRLHAGGRMMQRPIELDKRRA